MAPPHWGDKEAEPSRVVDAPTKINSESAGFLRNSPVASPATLPANELGQFRLSARRWWHWSRSCRVFADRVGRATIERRDVYQFGGL
jgi:hypothetical protein